MARHSGHHLGEPNHEFDLAAAATCDVTFGPDALSLRRIERGGHDQFLAGLEAKADFDGHLGEEVELLRKGAGCGDGIGHGG